MHAWPHCAGLTWAPPNLFGTISEMLFCQNLPIAPSNDKTKEAGPFRSQLVERPLTVPEDRPLWKGVR